MKFTRAVEYIKIWEPMRSLAFRMYSKKQKTPSLD